jgi:hypothetical protein
VLVGVAVLAAEASRGQGRAPGRILLRQIPHLQPSRAPTSTCSTQTADIAARLVTRPRGFDTACEHVFEQYLALRHLAVKAAAQTTQVSSCSMWGSARCAASAAAYRPSRRARSCDAATRHRVEQYFAGRRGVNAWPHRLQRTSIGGGGATGTLGHRGRRARVSPTSSRHSAHRTNRVGLPQSTQAMIIASSPGKCEGPRRETGPFSPQ